MKERGLDIVLIYAVITGPVMSSNGLGVIFSLFALPCFLIVIMGLDYLCKMYICARYVASSESSCLYGKFRLPSRTSARIGKLSGVKWYVARRLLLRQLY